MGAGAWAMLQSEQQMIDAMSGIQRVGMTGVASEVAKGDAFQKGKYKGDIDKFERDMTDIERSKSDSMFGQAEAVRENYKKNPNMYAQNALYGEESKQQATNAKIKALNGIDAAVALDVKQATGKARADINEIENLDKWNKDKGGYIGAMETKGGMNAVATMGGLAKPDIYNEKNMKDFYDELKKKGIDENKLSDLKNPDGSFKTGLDATAVMAQHAAGNVQGQHGVVFGDKSVGASFSKDDVRVGMVDDSTARITGESTKINTEGKFKSQISAFQAAHKGRSPENLQELAKWVETSELAESAKNDFFGNLVNTIATYAGTEDKTELMAAAAGMGFGGYALNKAIGDPAGKTWGGVKSATDKLRGISDKAMDKPTHGSDYDHNNKPGNSHSEETTHNKSFNSDKDNISKNTENGKGERGFSQGKTTSGGIHVPDDFDLDGHGAKGGGSWMSRTWKQTARSLPFIGTAFGLGFAAEEALAGNYTRAGLEFTSAVADMVPGIGTPIGLSADAALMAGVGLPNKSAAPAHLQGFASQPSGFHTMQAMNGEMPSAANITTLPKATQEVERIFTDNQQGLERISSSRQGSDLTDGSGSSTYFGMDKSTGNLSIGGQVSNIPYESFQQSMSNGNFATEMAAAVSNTSMKSVLETGSIETFSTADQLMADLVNNAQRSSLDQKRAANAGLIKADMHHKENMSAYKTTNYDPYQ